MKLWKRTVLLMLVTAIVRPDPSGSAKSFMSQENEASIMLQRPTEDSWKTERHSWNNFGITANMSRCPRLESRLIWAFSSSDAVGTGMALIDREKQCRH